MVRVTADAGAPATCAFYFVGVRGFCFVWGREEDGHLDQCRIRQEVHENPSVALVGEAVEVDVQARAQSERRLAELLHSEVQPPSECDV